MNPQIADRTIVFGLDLGNHLGWCIRYGANSFVSGVADVSKGRTQGARFYLVQEWLKQSLDNIQAAAGTICVAYEKVRRHRGVQAAHFYGGLQAILHAECHRRQIIPMELSVQEIKEFATRWGNASKESVIAAAKRRWPDVDIQDDNEADARWICELGYKKMFK